MHSCELTCNYCYPHTSPSLPPPSPPPLSLPPPSPKAPCAKLIDFTLVLDESGSMRKYMEGDDGLKTFAKELVSQYSLAGETRFSLVSFAENATTRVPWSITDAEITTGIDAMKADGPTSISGGFEAAESLLAHARPGATKIVLFLSDGKQSEEFAAPDKTPLETAIDAATRVKNQGATVFAWGFGNQVNKTTLMKIASDESKAHLEQSLTKLTSYYNTLPEVCVASPSNSSPTETETQAEAEVVLMLTVSGSVSDFSDDDKLGLQQNVADAAGVDESLVEISVAAASVLITATIVVPASTTVQKVQESLSSKLGTAEAASEFLYITVEEDPVTSPQETTATPADQSTPAYEHVTMTLIGGSAAAVALLALRLLAFASR